jgi:hypothetical protein
VHLSLIYCILLISLHFSFWYFLYCCIYLHILSLWRIHWATYIQYALLCMYWSRTILTCGIYFNGFTIIIVETYKSLEILLSILPTFFFFFFLRQHLTMYPRLPPICDPPTSASHVLGLQACATMASSRQFLKSII